MWTALIGPISNIACQWLTNRQEKAVAKQKLAVAKIEAQVKKVEQTGNWEELAMKKKRALFIIVKRNNSYSS